jgi:hypothetical protein
MRLNGRPPDSSSSITQNSSPNGKLDKLVLKNNQDFKNILNSPQFIRVEGQIVDTVIINNLPNTNKYSFGSRDQNTSKNSNKFIHPESSSSVEAETESINVVGRKSNNSDKSNNELFNQLKYLRNEIAEIKDLVVNNQIAINSSKPMPAISKQSLSYSKPLNQGSTLTQADLHYLRYGNSKSNLDIWA